MEPLQAEELPDMPQPLKPEEGGLPYADITEPTFQTITPTMEEAELLGAATMNLVNCGLQLSDILDTEGNLKDLTDPDVIRQHLFPIIYWAGQLQYLMEVQSAKAGLGMIP